MRHVSAAALAVLALALTGCGGEPASAPSSSDSSTVTPIPSAQPTAPESGPCSVLSQQQVETLAGQSMSQGRTVKVGNLPACQWPQVSGPGYLQVARASASTWAKALPPLVDQLLEVDTFAKGENRTRLLAAKKLVSGGGTLSPARACTLFSTLVELQGEPAGSTQVVNYLPDDQAPQGVSAQACQRGRYASVLLADPKLQKSDALAARMAKAPALLLR